MRTVILLPAAPGIVHGLFLYSGVDESEVGLCSYAQEHMSAEEVAAFEAGDLAVRTVTAEGVAGLTSGQMLVAAGAMRLWPDIMPQGYAGG